MFTSATLLSALLALTGPYDAAATPGLALAQSTSAEVVVRDCLVELVGESHVAAEQPGKLLKVVAVEGLQVTAGDLLAQVDDEEARMAHEVAVYKSEVAEEKIKQSGVNIEYSQAAYKVATAEWQQAVQANRRVPGTKPQAEINRLELTAEKSRLEIVQAQSAQGIAQSEAEVAKAEVRAAAVEVEHRLIKSPIDGMVVEVKKHLGEWVQPGDEVAHIVRLDRLRIQGRLQVATSDPAEIHGKAVTVVVELAHGRQESFTGEITFVDPRANLGGEYAVCAEVLNRKINDNWVLRPGVRAQMTIHLGAAKPAPPAKVQM